MRKSWLIVIILLLLVLPTVFTSVPTIFRQSIVLYDRDNAAVTATKNVNLSIWNAYESGNMLWSKIFPIEFVSGVGLVNMNVSSISWNNPRYIEIKVPPDHAVKPRINITVMPYCLFAKNSSYANDASLLEGQSGSYYYITCATDGACATIYEGGMLISDKYLDTAGDTATGDLELATNVKIEDANSNSYIQFDYGNVWIVIGK